MTYRAGDLGKFEFVTLATLRTAQLMRGSIPRVRASHKMTTTALREVGEGKVCGLPRVVPAVPLIGGG